MPITRCFAASSDVIDSVALQSRFRGQEDLWRLRDRTGSSFPPLQMRRTKVGLDKVSAPRNSYISKMAVASALDDVVLRSHTRFPISFPVRESLPGTMPCYRPPTESPVALSHRQLPCRVDQHENQESRFGTVHRIFLQSLAYHICVLFVISWSSSSRRDSKDNYVCSSLFTCSLVFIYLLKLFTYLIYLNTCLITY